MRELERLGILIKETVSGDSHSSAGLPQYCNQSEFAEILNERFGKQAGKTYGPMDVSRLKEKWKGQPWFEEVFLKNGSVRPSQGVRRFEEGEAGHGGSTLAKRDDAITRRQIAAAAREERANEEENRKMDARWMLTDAHEFFCDNFGTIARLTANDLVERKVKTAVESALKAHVTDPVLLEKIYESLRPVYAPLFEMWQSEFEAKILEFDRQCREQSEQKKARLKVK